MDSVVIAVFGAIGGLVTGIILLRLILGLLPASPLGETINPHVPMDWRADGICRRIGTRDSVCIWIAAVVENQLYPSCQQSRAFAG